MASCVICNVKFKDHIPVQVLECGHIVHSKCIYIHLKECPYCDKIDSKIERIHNIILKIRELDIPDDKLMIQLQFDKTLPLDEVFLHFKRVYDRLVN
jgi:hypothetical protein